MKIEIYSPNRKSIIEITLNKDGRKRRGQINLIKEFVWNHFNIR